MSFKVPLYIIEDVNDLVSLPSESHTKATFLSSIILGGQDGLVNVLGVILGVAVATEQIRIILAAGLAATFAESISMAAVAYTSKMAEKDHYNAELKREKKEIEEVPEVETQEIRDIYKAKGFSGKLLEEITAHITKNKEIWLATMMREELGLYPINKKDVIISSIVVGSSALLGSFIPLIPFFFLSVKTGITVSLVVSASTLFFVGVYKGKTTVGRPMRSGVELAAIGMGAAIIGYGIGLLFK